MTAVRWLVTAAETEGRLARVELRLPPGSGESTHTHPDGEERLELLAGAVTLEVGGCRIGLRAGDDVTIPAGVAHAWRNAGPGELHLVIETQPSRLLADLMAVLLPVGAIDSDNGPSIRARSPKST
jgi:quercetin dioxygenase-like cupin family protein